MKKCGDVRMCVSIFIIFMFDNIIQLFFLVECLYFLNPWISFVEDDWENNRMVSETKGDF